MIFKIDAPEKAEALLKGWQETIIWSCLQGVMGAVYGDALETPASVMALLGDFCFLAGKPEKEFLLRAHHLAGREFLIFIPKNQSWADLIEDCFRERARKTVRYAFKKEPDVFDRERLQALAGGLSEGYTLKMMDEKLFRLCGSINWCKDWTAQYENYEMYQKYGLGAVILKEGEPVSGASSYSGFRGGIEVEIDTREDHRRKGLACICGARLILECLDRGWYPSWDAQNLWSAVLAEKFGYRLEGEYRAYEVVQGPEKTEQMFFFH